MTRPSNSLGPLALATLAAGPFGAAHASLATSSTSPSFSCTNAADPGAGGSISWPSGISVLTPTLSYLSSGSGHKIDGTSALDCSGGGFSEVAARKAGEGQKDFIVVKMKDVLVSGFAPDVDPATGLHYKMTVSSMLGAFLDDVQYYDTYWNLVSNYKMDVVGSAAQQASHFLGFKFSSAGAFEGLDQVSFSYVDGELNFVAPTQARDGVLSLAAAPFEVPEPGSLAVLGTGLLGLAAAGRRRRNRGW